MSHTTTVQDRASGQSFYVNHNSDWSGEAHLHWTDIGSGKRRDVVLPGRLLLSLSRRIARSEVLDSLEGFLTRDDDEGAA